MGRVDDGGYIDPGIIKQVKVYIASKRKLSVGDERSGRLFFFQAEDGIRDVAVTGVQTCALPISPLETNLARQPADAVAPPWGLSAHSASSSATAPVELFPQLLAGRLPGGPVVWRKIGRASCRERV